MSADTSSAPRRLTGPQKRLIRAIALEAAEDGYEAGFRGEELYKFIEQRVEQRLRGRLTGVDWYLVLEFLKVLMPLIIALLI
jgi:hypothetical protein